MVSVSDSGRIRIESLIIEADSGDVDILLDGTGNLTATPAPPVQQPKARKAAAELEGARGVVDITIEDLVIDAWDRPAILACAVRQLDIKKNRLALSKVVSGTWPVVWVSGREIRTTHNWIGISGLQPLIEIGLNPGGIQVAGPAHDVFILENIIENCGRNGITLGSYSVLDYRPSSGGANSTSRSLRRHDWTPTWRA
ncbi:MAG TPA: hypothetical protein VEK34_04450 [Methylocella sp.]|nr:hypothetical protein [Methylocella sp.]